ncbi:MAG: hypothetical protein OIN66_14060 [Candidatus Methanoperedens sp.]|nr:hypothetical protein [Candidatus Methanoperedens sp.]
MEELKTDRNMAKENEKSLNSSNRGFWRKVLYLLMAIIVITSIIFVINFKQEETLPSENGTLIENTTLIQEKIKSKLIGMELTYYDKRGELEKYTVNESDIKMINETWLDNKRVWKVRIGVGISWDYYFDETGENIVKTVQLFRT